MKTSAVHLLECGNVAHYWYRLNLCFCTTYLRYYYLCDTLLKYS